MERRGRRTTTMKDDGQMDDASEWSPDAPLGTETFEQGDEATEEEDRLHPDFDEQLAADPGLDPELLVDERALEELGSELDDPEGMGTLDGGGDDPDGIGGPTPSAEARSGDAEGWDLDAEDDPFVAEDLNQVESLDD